MTSGEQGRLSESCHPAPIQTRVGEGVMARDRLGPGPTWKRAQATPGAKARTRPRPLQAVSKCPGPGRKDQGGTRVYINHWFCVYIFSYVYMFSLYMYAPGGAGPPQRSQHGSGWANIHKICMSMHGYYTYSGIHIPTCA